MCAFCVCVCVQVCGDIFVIWLVDMYVTCLVEVAEIT